MTTFLFASAGLQQTELDVLANLDEYNNDIEAAAKAWSEDVEAQLAAGIIVDDDDDDDDEPYNTALGREVVRALHMVVANHHGRRRQ